jgi:GNAT superfamily N-acetyltransferase
MELSIRNLSAADIETADRILMAAFETPESRVAEMRRFLEVQPDGWFVAERTDLLLGMVGAMDYGAFAYIGLMAVQPEFQGHGIGRLLMERVLGWLDQRGTPSVLDATEMGYPLYKKLGFVETDLSCVYVQDQPLEIEPLATPIYTLQMADLDELAAFDTPLFGADRSNILRALLRDYPGGALAARDETGKISGFCIIRERRLSPWMALDPSSAERLLQAALASAGPGKPAAIIPRQNRAGMQLLERYGFTFKRSCRHMQRGSAPVRQRIKTYGLTSFAIG